MKSSEIITPLIQLLGRDAVHTDPADTLPYGYDNSRRQATPQAVLFPNSTQQVQGILALCNQYQTNLIPRGTGTGTTGASVPHLGGIILSTERLNRIIKIDPDNRLARIEPGVTNQALQQAAAEHGFFWPPDPTSSAICTIGGNLAYNSAGPRAVKYGTPRDNTLGLTAVTGSGEIIHTGVSTSKGVVGYDLTRLIIGSEGTLAIITEATLSLTPLQQSKRTLRATYHDIHAAAHAVSAIMAQPVTPCALEFMDGAALKMVSNYADLTLDNSVGALLMIEIDGPEYGIEQATAAVSEAAHVTGVIEVTQATTAEEVAALWKTRKSLSPALRTVAPKKINEDVVVPVSHIPALIAGLEQLAQQHQITIINFGHAGNGNIHVNLLVDPDDHGEMQRAHRCLDALFDLVLKLDGTLSGEHGIGLEKQPYIDREIDPPTLQLMRAIKNQFDPNNILNPGKIFPSQQNN
ncbi:MAG: FAD-binding protein [Candidatus Polarisedimenticolaceae bacterium]|nr:FAD-binding protein [Candidatus Polarisedimenticolaceae bacterium]